MVKFAKVRPLLGENDRNLLGAVEFVKETQLELTPEELNPKLEETVVEERRSKEAGIAILSVCLVLGAAFALGASGVQIGTRFIATEECDAADGFKQAIVNAKEEDIQIIESPAKMVVKNGESVVTITWSSPNYDYMLLDGVKYEPVNTEGNSVFELPIKEFGVPVTVIGDTTAMSKPHEVEYKITCNIQ